MKILCLLDFPVRKQHRWLWEDVPENQDEIDFLTVQNRDIYKGWGKLFSGYPALFYNAARAVKVAQSRKYDVIIGWEGKNSIPLGIMRAVSGRKTPPLIALAFSLRGPFKQFRPLNQLAMKGIDLATVPTRHEVNIYTQPGYFPNDRCRYSPLGVYNPYPKLVESPIQEYLFSGGRSGRDFETQIYAVNGLEYSCIINSRKFNLKGIPIPSNVLVNDILPAQEYHRLQWAARLIVVPLFPVDEAVGLSEILYAMSAGKTVVATQTHATIDYVQDGVNGVFVPAGDPKTLREAIVKVWNDPERRKEIGQRARATYLDNYSFPAFARRTDQLIRDFIL